MNTDINRRLEDFPDAEIIEWVRRCEVTGDTYRWAAARGYAYLNHERGLGIRGIARSIGRSKTHVGRMIQVWDRFGGSYMSQTLDRSFSELENELANPAPKVEIDDGAARELTDRIKAHLDGESGNLSRMRELLDAFEANLKETFDIEHYAQYRKFVASYNHDIEVTGWFLDNETPGGRRYWALIESLPIGYFQDESHKPEWIEELRELHMSLAKRGQCGCPEGSCITSK